MFLKELKLERKSLIIWSISMIIFLFAGMQKYTAFTGVGSKEMLDLFEKMPNVLKAMFGMSSLDVTSITGYYGMLYFYLVLILAVHALLNGIKMVSKDEMDKTAEFLYTKPITRQRILFNKLLVSLVVIVVINLMVYVPALFIIYQFSGKYLVIELLLSSIACFLIQLLFLSIGYLLAIVFRHKKAMYTGLMILTFTLLLSVAIDVIPDISFLEILTPFKYADPKMFINELTLNFNFIILEIIIISIIQLISFKKIDSKDF